MKKGGGLSLDTIGDIDRMGAQLLNNQVVMEVLNPLHKRLHLHAGGSSL